MAHTTTDVGFLHMIIGPMCAGKTTELIQKANRESAIGRRVLLVNHALDNRHDTGRLSTHADKEKTDTRRFASVSLSDLADLMKCAQHKELLAAHDVICIDELQFFQSPSDMIRFLVSVLKKKVYAAGLVADYKQCAFGEVLPLLAFADSFQHCTGLCTVCNDGTVGCFTKRRGGGGSSVISVGDCESEYMLVCRRHFTCDEEDATLPHDADTGGGEVIHAEEH